METVIINGIECDLFDSMFEYVVFYGSDISHYKITSARDENYIVDEFEPIEDSDFVIRDEIEVGGEIYVGVNWGEDGNSFVLKKMLYQTLYTIYERIDENWGFSCISKIFDNEDEAQEKADELNAEEEN